MEKFEKAEMEIVFFENEDVITTSSNTFYSEDIEFPDAPIGGR